MRRSTYAELRMERATQARTSLIHASSSFQRLTPRCQRRALPSASRHITHLRNSAARTCFDPGGTTSRERREPHLAVIETNRYLLCPSSDLERRSQHLATRQVHPAPLVGQTVPSHRFSILPKRSFSYFLANGLECRIVVMETLVVLDDLRL